jgi:DNA-binding beta-propeller fold protein YncE
LFPKNCKELFQELLRQFFFLKKSDMLNSNKYYLLFAFSLFVIIGCSKHIVSDKPLVIYPSPPDTARIQYLTSYSNSLDLSGKRTALQKTVLGEDPGMPISKPYGIATAKGKVFICDATIKGLYVIDLAKNTLTRFVPAGKGTLKLPLNCFIDQEGKLYVTDGKRKEVVVFDENLNYVTAITKPATADDFKPMDVGVSDKKIFVTNPATHQIYVYQKEDYKLLKTFPDSTAGDEQGLLNPLNIFYRNGKVYVTDFGDFKIKIFSEDGNYLGSVGEYGKIPGQFVRPKGLSVDKDDNLYVADAGFENVQIFNSKRKLLMFFGGPYHGPGDMWLPAKVFVDYENLQYYKKWVSPDYELSYLIFVSNQYGPDKISVYGAVKPAMGTKKVKN